MDNKIKPRYVLHVLVKYSYCIKDIFMSSFSARDKEQAKKEISKSINMHFKNVERFEITKVFTYDEYQAFIEEFPHLTNNQND